MPNGKSFSRMKIPFVKIFYFFRQKIGMILEVTKCHTDATDFSDFSNVNNGNGNFNLNLNGNFNLNLNGNFNLNLNWNVNFNWL